MSDLMHYDSLVERHNAAYAAFKLTYEARIPPPVLRPYDEIEPQSQRVKVKRDSPLALVALAIMALASVIVSGSRTIEEFGGGFVGISGFAMIELGIVAYAFIRTKTDYNEQRHASVKKLVNWGMWLAFAVAVVANTHHELQKAGVEIADGLNILILVVLGISAPVLAFISGDVFGMFAVKDAYNQRKADEEYERRLAQWHEARRAHEAAYEAALNEWREALNASWNSQKAKWGVRIEAVPEPVQVVHSLRSVNEPVNEYGSPIHSANRSVNPANGYSKNMNARAVVSEWLLANLDARPELLTMKVDELHALVIQETSASIGRTSVHNVRKEILANRGA